jgi:hypothetical protein
MGEEESAGYNDNPLAPIVQATNLPNTLKGKAQRVFLRFLAGSLAHPYVREVRQNLDDMDARSRINMMVAEEIGRQAIADPAFIERAKARLLGEIVQKQENLEAVLVKANEKVEQTAGEDVENIGENEPSQDWINSFTREAELASSDELRDRLAAILAGEIKNPGLFSRSTIRTVAEMDQEILQYFSQALQYRFGDSILREDHWNSGEMFKIGMALENAALISGTTGFIHKTIKANDKGNSILHLGETALVIKSKPGLEKQLSCWLMTKVGQQIANLLGSLSNVDQLKLVTKRVDKSDVTAICLGRVINDGALITHDQQLWPEAIAVDIGANTGPGFGGGFQH